MDSSIDSVTDGLFLFVFILNGSNLLSIYLDWNKRRNGIVGSLLLLLWLLLLLLLHGLSHVHRHSHLGLRHLLIHHLLLLRNWHLHIVIVLVHSLLLVHVASASTTTLSSLILIISIVVILTLHIVILVLVIVIVTTHIRYKIVQSHGEWVT